MLNGPFSGTQLVTSTYMQVLLEVECSPQTALGRPFTTTPITENLDSSNVVHQEVECMPLSGDIDAAILEFHQLKRKASEETSVLFSYGMFCTELEELQKLFIICK
jgi:hypothetical protein